MSKRNEGTDESVEDRLLELQNFGRRPLLKALGLGAALSFGSGVTAADGDDSEGGDTDSRSREIDPEFGYPTMDATAIPPDLEPKHEVELGVIPPEGPGKTPLFYFDPIGLHVRAGDVVQFTFASPDHSVTAMHPAIGPGPRVPEGSPPFSSPVMGPGAAWLYRFEHEGVYDLYCAPHLDFGMVMRLVVGDVAEGDLPEYARTVEDLPSRESVSRLLNELSEQNEGCEWPFLLPAEILGTDALDALNIQDSGQVPFGHVAKALGREFQPAAAGDGRAPTVRVRDHDEHGAILVGPDEMTLYMFDRDTRGRGESSCYDDCSDAWPPLTVEDEPAAGEGVEADLTTFEREGGRTQVAANGWPLYYFARDEAPGDVRGQGANGSWWVLRHDGAPLRPE